MLAPFVLFDQGEGRGEGSDQRGISEVDRPYSCHVER
jgi:hypothetical protein